MGNGFHPAVAVDRTNLVASLRDDESESAYQRLRQECRAQVVSRLGERCPALDPVTNQVVHDLFALILAPGFTIADIVNEEWPDTVESWTDPENWDAAWKRTLDDPSHMTLEDEKRINLERRFDSVADLARQASRAMRPRDND